MISQRLNNQNIMVNQENFPLEVRRVGKVICAWCDKELGEKEDLGGDSHGLCLECKEMLKSKEIKKEIPRKDWEMALAALNIINNTILRKDQIIEYLAMKYRSLLGVYLRVKPAELSADKLPEIAQKLREVFHLP